MGAEYVYYRGDLKIEVISDNSAVVTIKYYDPLDGRGSPDLLTYRTVTLSDMKDTNAVFNTISGSVGKHFRLRVSSDEFGVSAGHALEMCKGVGSKPTGAAVMVSNHQPQVGTKKLSTNQKILFGGLAVAGLLVGGYVAAKKFA